MSTSAEVAKDRLLAVLHDDRIALSFIDGCTRGMVMRFEMRKRGQSIILKPKNITVGKARD